MNGSLAAPLALLAVAACATVADQRASPTDPAEVAGLDSRQAPNANTLFSMSKILVSRNRDADAETLLSKLIRNHPEFMPAYLELSQLYLRHERLQSAVEVLKAGVEVAPTDAVMQNNLGMCRMLQKRFEDALECFTAAATGIPTDVRARANMAVALGMLGRYDESFAMYLQLVSPAEAHHNLGILYEARGEVELARKEFAIADSLSPARTESPESPARTEKKRE